MTKSSKNSYKRPVLLVILDGFGANPDRTDNAVALARTPRLDHYFSRHPSTLIQASGPSVGLPDGQMGNSEVGHMTLGSGTVVKQDLVQIDAAIADGSFKSNDVLREAIFTARARNRPVHLLGLVSDGGVHSHVRHLIALIDLCREMGVKPLVHMVTDGRDTIPKCAKRYLPEVETALAAAGGRIATLVGRYFAMDRDNRWDRVERAWRAIVVGNGRSAAHAEEAISAAYETGHTDEFIRPFVIDGYRGMTPEDVLISFNFRKDRPRQIVAALADPNFAGFDRGDCPRARVTCMMEYDPALKLPAAFAPEQPSVTIADVLSKAGLAQFHCAETEKYAHVTYFFNGGRREVLPKEVQKLVPSPDVATYDLKPEMSAPAVANAVIDAMASGRYPFIVVNFANGDMVGHTGIRHAVLRAVESLDQEVGRVLDGARRLGYSTILTADHGNCDQMIDPETKTPHTQHTRNPVPFLVIDDRPRRLLGGGGLANVAPTVLELMGLPKPDAMTGESLLAPAA
ncbi:MAG: 2,3-bisphosphoglycerate-independent phosphoglycerate mutase [Chromatiales bacterium]|nr:2,3-bisphosphoglycerate-independent phosphoglycerate mutase [Chromatiales bacterium]